MLPRHICSVIIINWIFEIQESSYIYTLIISITHIYHSLHHTPLPHLHHHHIFTNIHLLNHHHLHLLNHHHLHLLNHHHLHLRYGLLHLHRKTTHLHHLNLNLHLHRITNHIINHPLVRVFQNEYIL